MPGGDASTAEAVDQLTNTDVDALFIYYDTPDDAGHSCGFDPLAACYIEEIENTDGWIGELITAIEGRSNFANEDW